MTGLLLFALIMAVAFCMLGLATMNFNKTISCAGVGGSASQTVTGESMVLANPTVAVAKSGTLTTRTSDTAGSLTMEAGHGITTGQIIDLYWSGGSCYGVTVGTVSGTTVPIATVSGGDVLPIATTAMRAGIRNSATFDLVGDDLQGLLVTSSVEGYATFVNGSTIHFAVHLTAGVAYSWENVSSGTNPIAGDTITDVLFSQQAIAAAITTMNAVAVAA